MTDRTLLEKAAKAAGYAVKGEVVDCSDVFTHLLVNQGHGTRRFRWNPLADDGDALRLATALELDITFNAFGDSEVMVSDSKDRFDGWFTEPYGTDKAAATRRVIVRAAAALSESP